MSTNPLPSRSLYLVPRTVPRATRERVSFWRIFVVPAVIAISLLLWWGLLALVMWLWRAL